MLKNHILITLRNMMKNKLYIFINIFGMAIAIGCCIVGYFNYDFNASFDTHHKNANEIYRVNTVREFQNNLTEYGYVPIPLGESIRQNVGDVKQIIRYSNTYANLKLGDEIFDSNIAYVDPDFFKVFTFEFIEGSANDLTGKNKIFISDEEALKLFNDTKVVGKSFVHLLEGENRWHDYEIAGVFRKQPTNSSFDDPCFTVYENFVEVMPDDYQDGNNWKYRNTTFVTVTDPSRISSIEQQINGYAENNNKVREDFVIRHFKLESFVGMAVRDSYDDKPGTWTRDGSPLAAVVGVGLMGILVLLIACFNLTNTSIAISSRRLKEIGIRKVMGSMRKQLVFQFIGETLIVCFIALILGLLIGAFLLMPAFNMLWPELKLTADYTSKPDFLIFLSLTLLFTALLAGSYPAFYISKFEPVSILKGKLKFGGTNYFTRILLALQFAISLTGIVCSFAFTENARYQRDFDMGFKQKEVLFTWVSNESEFNALRDKMAQNPDVISMAGSEHHIFSSAYNDPIKHQEKEIEVDIMHVGDNYLSTAGLTLTSGRDFVKDSETDKKESVIITEKAATLFGWDKPLGKEIIWMDTVKLYVVGVVKDIYNNGLWEEMYPMMIRYSTPDTYRHLIVTAPVNKIVDVNKYMEAKWKEIFPNKKFASRYMDDETVEASTVNNNIVKMFVFLGIVAMILSATGLFTLVSLNIIKKMKEIGIRKVLGASVANITRVINTEFAIILLAACLGGSFLGAWMSGMLMDSIWDFYQRATVTTLVTSSAIMLIVCVLSVGMKIYNTARMNPVNTLRDE
ncbi:MAG: ABC transporter permease [Flammeovirgaceae bacterium]|nr:ABC transporter permease [Flammeovirgaceae bacterium]